MTDLLPPIVDGKIVEEKKDIYAPFWEYHRKNEYTPTLFQKFADRKMKKHRGKGARIQFA